MAKASIRDRLEKLENHQRFLVWFVTARFYATLTLEELEMVGHGRLSDPLPQRPSPLDGVDRKTLIKRWKEDGQIFRGRSAQDLEYYIETAGSWPEQRGGIRYSMEDGKLIAEWRNEREDGIEPENERKET